MSPGAHSLYSSSLRKVFRPKLCTETESSIKGMFCCLENRVYGDKTWKKAILLVKDYTGGFVKFGFHSSQTQKTMEASSSVAPICYGPRSLKR